MFEKAQYIHYNRNVFNTIPCSPGSALELGFRQLNPFQSQEHTNGGRDDNAKYVHPNGSEVIFRSGGRGIDNSSQNMGTFNYGPKPISASHIGLDWSPYKMWGNTPYDLPNDGPLNDSATCGCELGLRR